MSYYIVCQKKRNNPRVDIRICEKKCALKVDCKDYISYHKTAVQDKCLEAVSEFPSVDLKAA